MKKFGRVAVIVVALVIAAKAGAEILGFDSDSIRYKVTVSVETPEGIKTGSAVREAGMRKEPRIVPQSGGTFYNVTKGEAVVVDLGKRGVLFAMVGTQGEPQNLFKMFPEGARKGKAALSPDQYPLFARFRDLNDPKTIENVRGPDDMEQVRKSDPRRPLVTFEEVYGAGVGIKEVMIEVTSEPVTGGIEKYLPWVKAIGRGTLGGERFNIGQEWYNQLGSSEFKREIK